MGDKKTLSVTTVKGDSILPLTQETLSKMEGSNHSTFPPQIKAFHFGTVALVFSNLQETTAIQEAVSS